MPDGRAMDDEGSRTWKSRSSLEGDVSGSSWSATALVWLCAIRRSEAPLVLQPVRPVPVPAAPAAALRAIARSRRGLARATSVSLGTRGPRPRSGEKKPR